jgi:hypothetical protein
MGVEVCAYYDGAKPLGAIAEALNDTYKVSEVGLLTRMRVALLRMSHDGTPGFQETGTLGELGEAAAALYQNHATAIYTALTEPLGEDLPVDIRLGHDTERRICSFVLDMRTDAIDKKAMHYRLARTYNSVAHQQNKRVRDIIDLQQQLGRMHLLFETEERNYILQEMPTNNALDHHVSGLEYTCRTDYLASNIALARGLIWLFTKPLRQKLKMQPAVVPGFASVFNVNQAYPTEEVNALGMLPPAHIEDLGLSNETQDTLLTPIYKVPAREN